MKKVKKMILVFLLLVGFCMNTTRTLARQVYLESYVDGYRNTFWVVSYSTFNSTYRRIYMNMSIKKPHKLVVIDSKFPKDSGIKLESYEYKDETRKLEVSDFESEVYYNTK